MADFQENMKAFTGRLKASIDDRAESLAGVHEATTSLLDSARMFLENVADEHQARAEAVHAFMARSHADRAEAVNAMRQSHRESFTAMADAMHRSLDEQRKDRTEFVGEFISTSRADRLETAQAMRDNHREQLATMAEELNRALDQANHDRLETVGAMRRSFQDARQALATDLREAATAWRQFASSR